MSDIYSVKVLLDQFQRGDQSAAAEIYSRFEKRLISLAKKKLGEVPKREGDEYDAVNSAYKSFFRRAKANEFDKLTNEEDLWKLMVRITVCKCLDHIERERRTRRKSKVGEEQQNQDGEKKKEKVFTGRVLGESTLGHPAGAVRVIEEVFDREPTAHEVVVFTELLAMLPADLRQIALWKLEANSAEEIANKLGWNKRRVERQIVRIRNLWTKAGYTPHSADDAGPK